MLEVIIKGKSMTKNANAHHIAGNKATVMPAELCKNYAVHAFLQDAMNENRTTSGFPSFADDSSLHSLSLLSIPGNLSNSMGF